MTAIQFDIKNGTLYRVKSHAQNVTIPIGVEHIENQKYMVFTKHSLLEKVIIPSSITVIGTNAFRGCNALQSISIPDGVTSIGQRAFFDCSSLKEIILPLSVTEIGDNAFFGCSSLQSVIIPTNVNSIGNGAFGNCYNLQSMNLPSSITVIGEYAFFGCSKLLSITLPEGIRHIRDGIFGDCTNLQSVVFPSNVLKIGQNAFQNCNNLQVLKLPEQLEEIGTSAFLYCTALQSVSIPDGVRSIGQSAFNGCKGLQSVKFPKSLKILGDCAFCDNKSLQTIIIPSDIKNIDFGSFSMYGGIPQFKQFEGCTKLQSLAKKQLKALGYTGGFNRESMAWLDEDEETAPCMNDEESDCLWEDKMAIMLGCQELKICKPTGVQVAIVIKIDGNSLVAYGPDLGPLPGMAGWVCLNRSKDDKEYYYLSLDYLKKYNIIWDILEPQNIDANCIGKLALCGFDDTKTPMIIEILSVETNENIKKIKLHFPEQLACEIESNEIFSFGPSTNYAIIEKENNEYIVKWENIVEK
jgi:hypothetical protein